MHSFDVAYVQIHGQQLILVPVHPRFGLRTDREMQQFAATIRAHASAAGLEGEVVPLWDSDHGHLTAFARRAVLELLKGLSANRLRRHLNVRLHVGIPDIEPWTEQPEVRHAVESLAS